LSQGVGASVDKVPTNRHYEIIRRNLNDAKKFEQYSKVTFILSGSNDLGAEPAADRGQQGFGGRAPNATAIFPAFSKK